MNSLRKHALRKSIYLLALGLSLIPGAAVAQNNTTSMEGKFALTSEARCGTAILPPGSYSFSLEADGAFSVIRISSGKHVVTSFISPPQVRKITLDQDVLTLVRRGGGPYVRSLDLPELGVEFKFPVPKSAATLMESPTLP
ncbi:MAG TPA: hypothetical protein VG028_09415 [Terriglobia bacterium]|nr:hypothetical protein [Terriglobia bacterium]